MGFSYMPSNPDSQGVSFCHENFPQDIYNVYLALEFLEKEIASKKGIVGNEIPKVFFNGEKPTDKTNVNAKIEYISETLQFKGYVDIKCQGTSSMAYPKKNYTIKLYKDEQKEKKMKVEMKDWGEQSKFCLKANYIDHSHARNICSARLWNQMVSSRENYEELPELLKTSPRNGAVDGFPIKVYYNNNYEGIYTWNIPKDKWMFNMDDKLEDHCVLCGEEYNSGCFLSANASAWSDEIHDIMPETIKRSFEDFQRFVINSSDDEFKSNLERYVFVDSLIDYYIFQYVICGLDSMGKNQLFVTYDGLKWIASAYDMDSTFGLYWNGKSFVSAEYRMQEDYESGLNTSNINNSKGNLLYYRLEQLFPNEIKARYIKVRSEVLSYSNIVNEFEKFTNIIPKDLYDEDLTIYTGIPSGETNNIIQIRNYIRDRLIYVDTKIEELGVSIPCTSISLNKAEITLGKVINNDGEPINYLNNITSGNHYNDLYFDSIILERGTYEFKNINGGTFTWLGYRINGVQSSPVDSTRSVTLNLNTYTLVEFHAYANNDNNNTYDKLAVYKIVDGNYSSEGMIFNTQLTPIIEPSDTTDSLIWSSSSDDVVEVNNGKLTTVSNGESIITVTCGTQSATCNVTVAGLVEESISYELAEETVFNGTDTFIDTEIRLLSNNNVNKDWTMLIDFTSNSTENRKTILHCMRESEPYPGLALDFSSGSLRAVVPNNSNMQISSPDTNRNKVVITKSGNTFTVYNESMEQLGTNTSDTVTTVNQTLLLGAYQTTNGTKGRFFDGTIHRFKLVEGVMSNDDCLNWMGTV